MSATVLDHTLFADPNCRARADRVLRLVHEPGVFMRGSFHNRSKVLTTHGAVTAFAVIAGLGSLAGCSRGEEADDSAPVAAASGVASATSEVTLQGSGLSVTPPEGPAQALRFGNDQRQTIAALSTILGEPSDQGTNSDCPSGPVQFASWSKGLNVIFEGGKFAGWAGAVDLKTDRGVGFGSTKADLVKAYRPTFESTSLGTEFTADGITGVLESDAADAAIADMWAGKSCVAR